MAIALYVIAGILVWVACGCVNRTLYGRLFNEPGAAIDMQLDLITALGPFGTLMIALMAGLMGYLSSCRAFARRIQRWNTPALLLIAIFVPWIGAGAANGVWYGRVFDATFDEAINRYEIDLILALGPVGSIMLALCAGLQGFLNLCALICGRRKPL